MSMENPFKNIIRDENLPETLKGKVLSDVESIQLMLDLADLTMLKYPASLNNILQTTTSTKKKTK